MTPSEFAASLPVPVRPAAARITRLFESFRYGHRPTDAHTERESLSALGELRNRLRSLPRAALRESPKSSRSPQSTQSTTSMTWVQGPDVPAEGVLGTGKTG